jgi:hypothetical protein
MQFFSLTGTLLPSMFWAFQQSLLLSVPTVILSTTFRKDLHYAIKFDLAFSLKTLLPQPNRAGDPGDTGPTSLSRRRDRSIHRLQRGASGK